MSVGLIKTRLRDRFGEQIESTYEVIGEPVTLSDAEVLAHQDPYQFQWWALSLVGARPVEQKKVPTAASTVVSTSTTTAPALSGSAIHSGDTSE